MRGVGAVVPIGWVLLVSAGGIASARGQEPGLPATRPADVVIEYSHGGGMRGDALHMELGAAGGRCSAGLRGAPRGTLEFPVPSGELDALYALLRGCALETIEVTPVRVLDASTTTITVRWSGGQVVASDGGGRLTEASQEPFARAREAVERYLERALDRHLPRVTVSVDASLEGWEHLVLLDDMTLLERRAAARGDWPQARTTRGVLAGPHALHVQLTRKQEGGPALQRQFQVELPARGELVISVREGEIVLEEVAVDESRRVRITNEQARAHGLPPVALELDLSGAPLAGKPCAQAGSYLALSGPPGGPLGLTLEPYADVPASAEGLAALAQARFAKRSWQPGPDGLLELGGTSCVVLSGVTDTSHARAVHLLALFPATEEGQAGVLLDFWCSAGAGDPLTPEQVLALPRYGDLLRAVRVRFD